MNIVLVLIGWSLNAIAVVAPRTAGKLTFALWGRPRGRAEVRVAEQAVHASARVERVEVNQHKIAVYRWGDGKNPVLMMHGWESRGSRFAAYVPHLLALGFSPIAADMTGHGDSEGVTNTIVDDRDVIHALDREYGPFPAMIAHSIGVLSSFYALRTGARVGRLVTIAGACQFGYLVEEFSRRLRLGKRVQRELRHHIERMYVPETDIWQRFSSNYDPSSVDIPILVIHDEDDEIVNPRQADLIVAAYPRAQLMMTRMLGHRRVVADGDVVKRVVDFVAAG